MSLFIMSKFGWGIKWNELSAIAGLSSTLSNVMVVLWLNLSSREIPLGDPSIKYTLISRNILEVSSGVNRKSECDSVDFDLISYL